MCIAILKPAGKLINKENLEECFIRNSDGAGFAYIKDGQMRVNKGYFNFKAFYNAYKRHENELMLIHFRIKTHGPVAIENCHPFFVQKDLAFIHNGIISQHSHNTALSDTRDFNETILKPLVQQFGTTIIFTDIIKKMLADYIGFSKLVFLDVNGNYAIINENKGFWDDGIWYSNQSYKISKSTYTPPTTTYKGKEYSTGKHTTPLYPRKRIGTDTYYLERDAGRIYENDQAIVYQWNGNSVPVNSVVTVLYIDQSATCDISLPSGIIIPHFPARCLNYYEAPLLTKQSVFDDSYSEAEVHQGFHF